MKISTITTYKELVKQRGLWEELLNNHKGPKHPFLDFDWISLYSKHFLPKSKLQIAIYQDNSRGAIAPFYYTRRTWRQLNCCIGNSLSDYGDLITNSTDFPQGCDLFVNNKVESVKFFKVRDDSPLSAIAKSFNDNKQYRVVIVDSFNSPYISLEGNKWQTYLMNLTGNLRNNISRKIKKISCLGELDFGYCRNHDELRGLLDVFYSQHIKRREYAGQNKSIFSNNRVRVFFNEMSQRMLSRSKLFLFYLKLNHAVIAMLYSFSYGKAIYYYIPTFDTRYAIYSPGYLLIYYLIKFSFENNMREIDFMVGDESYKFEWKAGLRQTQDIALFKKNTLGKIAFLDDKARFLYKRVKRKLINSKLKDIKRRIFKNFYRNG